MESVDLTEQNIEKIGMLFPSVITEAKDENGKLKKAINFTLLKQLLSPDVVEGDECYEFTWVGKKQSILDGSSPIRKTLRPCKEESKSWDTTENLYIEGDNLEVLKLLQGSYLNAIKMIYIDPPYNTGNDFVYKDSFATTKEEYDEEAGVYDEEENRLFKNTETNGRFHSDWCSMMYPRLQIASNLLADEGVIFISIDDNQVGDLKKICDEIFGEDGFIEQLVWKRRATAPNDRIIGKNHEYILIYSRSYVNAKFYLQERDSKLNARYQNPDNDPLGAWVASDLSANGKGGRLTQSCIFDIENPLTGEKFSPPQNKCWLYNKEKVNLLLSENRIGFREKSGTPFLKRYLSEVRQGATLATILDNHGFSQDSAKEIRALFDKDVFDFPKPIKLLKTLLTSGTAGDDIILDFFSGSATTAHAVMQLNAEDGGNRKFIMVQLPEATDEKSEAYKAGYQNICEIGKERIRRAGAKVEQEQKEKSKSEGLFASQEIQPTLDTGFRVLKLDSTNMKDVFYSAGEYTQQLVLDLESNIKDDRTDLDLLYGVLLDWGVPLSLPHETRKIEGKSVHFVNQTDLVACFEANVSEALIREVAKLKPTRVVFRDSSFGSSPDKINVAEIFKAISPDTTIKVL